MKPNSKKIPIIGINMTSRGPNNEYERLIAGLKKANVYSNSLLYVAIDRKDVRKIVRKGCIEGKILGWNYNYSKFEGQEIDVLKSYIPDAKPEDHVMAFTEEEVKDPDLSSKGNFLNIAFQYDKPTVVVLDSSKFGSACIEGRKINDPMVDYISKFNEPDKKLDALVAVTYLTYNTKK